MPWLTVHITLPLILLSGWAFDQLFGGHRFSELWSWRAAGVILLTLLTAFGIAAALSNLFGWGAAGDSAARRFTGAIIPAGIAALCTWLGLQMLQSNSPATRASARCARRHHAAGDANCTHRAAGRLHQRR